MKQRLYIIVALAACISCTVETVDAPEFEDSEYSRESTVTAVLEDIQTKNSLSDIDGERFILWNQGDAIGISGLNGGTNTKGILSDSDAGKREGSFTYNSENVPGGIGYAYYPYNSEYGFNGITLSASLPSVQKYVKGSVFAPETVIMTAKPEGGKLVFRSACSIVKIQLTGSVTLLSLKLGSLSGPLAGKGTVDMGETYSAFKVVRDPSYEVTLDLGEGVTLGQTPTPFYFVIPPGTYDGLIVTAETGEGTLRLNASASHSFEPRHIAPMKKMEMAFPSIDPVNLSANAFSNCWMIDPEDKAERYTFDLKKADGSALEKKIADVDCLWETDPGLVRDLCYRKSDGSFSFATKKGIAGNALIAAFDEEGTVIWSWHIWITSHKDQVRNLGEYGKFIFLDRNLGATYAPSSKDDIYAMTDADAVNSSGMMYQWGRKDPFPGASTFESEEKYEGTSASSGYFNRQGVTYPINALNGRTMPVRFHRFHSGYDGWEVSNMNASSSEMAAYPLSFNKILAKDNEDFSTSWANDITATGATAGWKQKKTVNDPCPAGYRVPEHSELLAFRYRTGTVDNITYSHSQPVRYSDLYASTGHYFSDGGYADIDGEFIFIPFAGIRASGYNSKNGNGWTGVMAFVGRFSNNYSASDCAVASWWTYKNTDSQAVLSGLGGFQNWVSASVHYGNGDIYQRFFMMSGQFNGNYQNGNMYDPNKVHALSCGSSVRCIKID